MDDELDPREHARSKRRDRDLDAEHRDLMRPGQGKVFKQILDHQAREATERRIPHYQRTKRAAR